jgi:diadenosine tetraphosphate (Ap4A) HIT family hydrolase
VGLNEYQARSVAVVLRALEDAIEIAPLRGDARRMLRTTEQDLTPAELVRLEELADAARMIVRRLAVRFDLEQDSVPLRRTLRARIATTWANLEDIQPAKLKRYGSVDPGLELSLGPEVTELIQIVLAMEAVLDGGPVAIERWRITCPFCDPIQRRPQVVAETAAFWVLADLQPLTPSHRLLVPKDHLPCFGALPEALDAEYAELHANLAAFLSGCSGQPLYFEHGVAGQTVPHAHLHALAVPKRLGLRKQLASLGEVIPTPDIRAIRRLYAASGPYVYVDEGDGPFAIPIPRLEPGFLQRSVRDLLADRSAPAAGSPTVQQELER